MAGSLPSSYWCYRCGRFITVPSHRQNSFVFCSDCNGGFVEEIGNPTRLPESTLSDSHRSRFPAADMHTDDTQQQSPTFRRNRRNAGDPVIVLSGRPHTGYEMFYEDGSGSGLRTVPVSMSDFLLGSGFERLLEQLTQIEANRLGRVDRNPRASKAAIEALPIIIIQESHVLKDSHCPVCKDPFELRTEALEMPCDHLYHSDCILPWLNLHNSCPVCRHELPRENQYSGILSREEVGLMVWRLPGGGFAVGRGGRESEAPVVFTEMDGGVDISGDPVSSWGSVGNGRRGVGGLRRVLGGWFSCFSGGGGRRRRRGGGLSSSSSSSSDDGVNGGSRFIPAIFSSSSRRGRAWPFDVNDRPQMW